MHGDDLRVKAAASVADAIRFDTAGDREAAAASYHAAESALRMLLETPGLASDGDRPSLERKIEQYARRAEQLRTAQLVNALPDIPDTNSAGAAERPASASPAASAEAAAGLVAAVGGAAAASAGAATTTGAAAQPASSSVSTIKAGFENASAAVARAKELDEKYQVGRWCRANAQTRASAPRVIRAFLHAQRA
jgi:hypothetical protein